MEIKKLKYTQYGKGGFDAKKPNNNIIKEFEYEEPSVTKLKKTNLLVYLSRIGKYKDLSSKLKNLTEEELIIFNTAEYLSISSSLVSKIKTALELTDIQIQGVFNRANEIKL